MPKKYGLGKGLDALLPAGESGLPESGITHIPIEDILPNPRQPRVLIDPLEISELAASILEHGVIQPLIVTRASETGQFTLIAGERRLVAAREAGLLAVPAIIREATEQQLVELALVENVQRADLSPLETAEAYRQLAEEFGLSHDAIASRVGKSRVAVTNTLRLLKLPDDVKRALADSRISEGHARALLALPTPESQSAVLSTVLKRELNVRQTEELVRKITGERPLTPPHPARSPELQDLEDRLRQRLGTRVRLNHRRKGGTLIIHYYSEEELNSLVNMILGEAG
jgi:ParB family chromosome partitioning protein